MIQDYIFSPIDIVLSRVSCLFYIWKSARYRTKAHAQKLQGSGRDTN